MPLNPAVPTVIGRPQTARKNVHAVAMPNPLAGLGDSLGNLGNGLGSLGLSIAAIQAERDDADYIRTRNSMIDTAVKRLNDEVYSQEGFAAEGSLERTERIFAEVLDQNSEQMAKMNSRNQRKLREDLGTWGNNQRVQVMNFERSHLQRAKIIANKATISNGVDQYAATLDEAMLEGALKAHADNWRLQNGGHLVDADVLRRFDEDVNDGDGYVQVRGGAKLKIVDEAEPGTPGVITKEQIKKQRESMVQEMEAYERSRQEVLDQAHAKTVDNYLANDDPDAAERYLKYIQTASVISDDILSKGELAVGKKRETLGEKERVARERAEAKAEAEQNKTERKNLQKINRLLDADQVDEAQRALNGMVGSGMFAMTEEAYAAAQAAIDRAYEARQVSLYANQVITELQALDPDGYGTEEQARKYTELRQEVLKNYSGDKAKLGRQIISEMDIRWNALQAAQEAKAASDVVSKMMEWQSGHGAPLDLSARIADTRRMKDSKIKKALLKALDDEAKAQKEELDNNTDPAFLVDQERRLNYLRASLSRGKGIIYTDGKPITFDFSKKDEQTAFVKMLGLSPKNKQKAADYISGSNNPLDVEQVYAEAARQLEISSPTEVMEMLPTLYAQLEFIKGDAVVEEKDRQAWLKKNINMLLSRKASPKMRKKGVDYEAVGDLIEQGLDPAEMYFTQEQAEDFMRTLEAERALLREDPLGYPGNARDTAQFRRTRPRTKDQVETFMRENFGMLPDRKGRFFYTRPNTEDGK